MSACATCLDTGYIEVEFCTCIIPTPRGHEPMCGTEPCPEGCWDSASVQDQQRGAVSA